MYKLLMKPYFKMEMFLSRRKVQTWRTQLYRGTKVLDLYEQYDRNHKLRGEELFAKPYLLKESRKKEIIKEYFPKCNYFFFHHWREEKLS